MKRIKSKKIIQGNNYDYQFEWCEVNDDSTLTFGIDDNFNDYVLISQNDNDYHSKVIDKLLSLKENDYEFYINIVKELENLNDTREKSPR